jgi:putative phage-type endonuclease
MTVEIVCETDKLSNADPLWHELRRAGIGGSDAPIVAGIPGYGGKNEYELWLEKISDTPPELTDQGENTRRYWGHKLEPVLAQEFSLRSGLEVHDVPLLLRSVEYPFMQANLDRVVRGENGELAGPLEIKTTSLEADWERVGDILTVPAKVQAQCVHYLAVTGYPKCFGIVLLLGPSGIHAEMFEIERTERLERELIAVEAGFWDLVQRRVAPSVDGSTATRRALSARWEAQKGKIIELPEQPTTYLWTERKRLVGEIRERKDLVTEIENELLAMCGDAEQANLGGEKLYTWKQGKTYRLDTRQLEKDQPALVASYRTLPPTRRPYWGRTSSEEES